MNQRVQSNVEKAVKDNQPQLTVMIIEGLRERYAIIATGLRSQHILDTFRHSGTELTVGEDRRRQDGISRCQTSCNSQGSGNVYLEHQGGKERAGKPAKGHNNR